MIGGGRLLIAAAPIGDPADASVRLRAAIQSVDVIAAEDTRRLRRLASRLNVVPRGRVVSYYDANEARRARELLDELRAGRDVLVVTDAGTPGVSDPGYRLVSAAIEAGIPVSPLPGPSAAVAALTVAGLPTDRFCFEGFLPRKASERVGRLKELAGQTRTMIFFEAPHRLAATLSAMVDVLGGDRAAVACRELTKTHEEVRRGALSDLAQWAADGVRGEVTLVVAGERARPAQVAPESLAAEVAARQAGGESRKDAIVTVARAHDLPKRVVYDAVHRQ